MQSRAAMPDHWCVVTGHCADQFAIALQYLRRQHVVAIATQSQLPTHMMVANAHAYGAHSNNGLLRANKNTPAVTTMAACSNALTGVGAFHSIGQSEVHTVLDCYG